VTEQPRFVIVGGEVFDRIATAPAVVQARFLEMLPALRRDPYQSAEFEIERARGWPVADGYIADNDGLILSYRAVEHDQGWIFLLEAMWV